MVSRSMDPKNYMTDTDLSLIHILMLKSECAVVAGIAQAALPQSVVAWEYLVEDYDRIRNDIEAEMCIRDRFGVSFTRQMLIIANVYSHINY